MQTCHMIMIQIWGHLSTRYSSGSQAGTPSHQLHSISHILPLAIPPQDCTPVHIQQCMMKSLTPPSLPLVRNMQHSASQPGEVSQSVTPEKPTKWKHMPNVSLGWRSSCRHTWHPGARGTWAHWQSFPEPPQQQPQFPLAVSVSVSVSCAGYVMAQWVIECVVS